MSNPIETSVVIKVDTDGDGKLATLSREVSALGEGAGEAAPEFQRLAEEIEGLAAKERLVDAFSAAKRETVAYGEALQASQAATREAAAALRTKQTALAAATTAEREASAALTQSRERHDELKRAVSDAQGALKAMRTEAKASGSDTAEYATRIREARTHLAELRKESATAGQATRALAADYRPVAQALKAASTEATQAQRAFEQNRSEAGRAKTAYEAQRLALHNARQALQAVGIASNDLAGAQVRLSQSAQEAARHAGELRTRMLAAGAAAQSAGTQTEKGFSKAAQGVRSISEQLATVQSRLVQFAGAQIGLQTAVSLGRTADEYANLNARLNLINTSQAGFNLTLETTAELARSTYTGLESTTNLVGALARAGEAVGLSQQEVLRLTESINKANQVSGASAASSDAALTQLIQGLQSGTLRGDEFNSVMEQSPRLAKALADGLGVPIGALRALAEEGKLTSEVVIGALQSQAATIDTEFSKLPLTIERAMTNLSTNWTGFIGEADQASGASSNVAHALETVANNLDSIAGAALTAGEIVVTALAVKAAAALRGYITLTGASTSAIAAQTGALGGLAAAGKAATGAMMTLGRAFPVLGAAALVAEFFRAKSAAEEADAAVRKMLETPVSNAVAPAIKLVATEAEAARMKLSAIETAFVELQGKGLSASAALDKLAASAKLDSSAGIAALINDFEKLRQGALATGQQIEDSLAARLRKLSAQDLKDFGIQAEMAFNQGLIKQDQLATALDSSLRVALGKLGIDADTALGGMSDQFVENARLLGIVTDNFDDLGERGINATNLVEQGIDTMLASASSPTELEALRVLIEQLGKDGKLSGDQVAEALDKVKQKADQITPGINSVAEALKKLGITSDADLKKTAQSFGQAYEAVVKMGGSVREQQAAFKKYAEAAIAANGGVVSSELKVQAAMRGMSIESDAAGKAIVRAGDEGAASLNRLGEKADETSAKIGEIKRTADGLSGVWDENGNLIPDKTERTYGGGSGGSGGGITSYTERGAYEKAKSEGLDDATALKLARQFADSNRLIEFQAAIDAAVLEAARRAAAEASKPKSTDSTSTSAPSATTPAQNTGVTYNVRVSIGDGSPTTIRTASQSDAEALSGLFQQLESARLRS